MKNRILFTFTLLFLSLFSFAQSETQIRSNMNLNNNQIRNTRIHNVTNSEETTLLGTLNSTHKGLSIFNTTTNQLKTWNGSAFVPFLTNTLNNGQILIGNGSNIATPVTMSGGATMSNSGLVTLSTSEITGKTLAGYTIGTNSAITSSNTILSAFGNLQAQINSISFTQAQSDWNETNNSLPSFIQNKPTLFDGTWNSLSGKPTLTFTNNAIPKGNGTGLVASAITDNGTTTSIGTNFNVTNTSGNTTITGTLGVTGATNSSSIVNSGNITTNTLNVGTSASIASLNVVPGVTTVSKFATNDSTIFGGALKMNYFASQTYTGGIKQFNENITNVRRDNATTGIPTEHNGIPTTLAVYNYVQNLSVPTSWIENGLSISSGKIRLGGSLITPTTITPTSVNTLSIANPAGSVFSVGAGGMTVGGATSITGATNIVGNLTVNSTTLGLTATNINLTGTTALLGTSTLRVNSLNVSGGIVRTNSTGVFSSSVLNSTDVTNALGFTPLANNATAGGELSGSYPNPTLATTAVTGKLLTGLSTGNNSQITATQSILQALQDLQAQINNSPLTVLQSSGSNNYPTPTFTANRPIFFLGSDYPQSAIATQMRPFDRYFLTVPNPPTSLTAGGLTATTATLNWTAPTNRNPDLSVTTTANVNYRVQYKQNSSGTWLTWGDVTTTTTQLTGLTNNTLYDARVYSFFDYDLAKNLSEPTAITQFTTTNASNKQTLINTYSPAYFTYTPNSLSLPSQNAIAGRNLGTSATSSTSTPTTPQDFSVIFGVNATGDINDIVFQITAPSLTQEVTLRVSAVTNTSMALWLYSNSGLIWNQDVATNVFNGTYKQVELRKTGSLFEVYVANGNNAATQVWSNSGFGSFPLDVTRMNIRSGDFGDNFPNMGTNAYVAYFFGTIPTRANIDAIFQAAY